MNARVWTGDPRRPWADAVVVRGDRLAFVGSGAEARKLTRGAPSARVIDARGRFLTRTHDPAGDVAGGEATLRSGEPAEFMLADRDPTAPASASPATPTLVVRAGRIVEER